MTTIQLTSLSSSQNQKLVNVGVQKQKVIIAAGLTGAVTGGLAGGLAGGVTALAGEGYDYFTKGDRNFDSHNFYKSTFTGAVGGAVVGAATPTP